MVHYANKLEDLIRINNGVISTKMVSEAGIPRIYLSDFVKRNLLERLDRGVYISEDSADDEMYCFQMRYEQVVFSHESSLFLHNLLDGSPRQHTVTVKTGVNTKSFIKSGAKVYSIKKELYDMGLTIVETKCGRMVRVYDIDRTICDVVRSRSQIDAEIITNALKKYNNNGNRDFLQLMKYAEQLKIAKILRSYLNFL